MLQNQTSLVESGGSSLNTSQIAPTQDTSSQSGEFLKNFKEKGFNERNSKSNADLEQLANSFRYSDLIPDEQTNDKLDAAGKNFSVQNNMELKGIRRSKSAVTEVSTKLSAKPPVENKDETEQAKGVTSKSKKNKHRFKTWRKKGVKMMKEIRRTSSIRTSELEGLDLKLPQHLCDQIENDVIDSPETPGTPGTKSGKRRKIFEISGLSMLKCKTLNNLKPI